MIVSPHARKTGVYAATRGSLAEFSIPDVTAFAPTEPSAARSLAKAWDKPLLQEDCDHGVVVPLALGFLPEMPIVAIALAEDADEDDVESLAVALGAVAMERDVATVCSAHTSASLSERAPVLLSDAERYLAIEDEVDFLESLQDAQRDARAALKAMTRSHSCSHATLALFTTLFDGPTTRLAYERPVGVGYLVAST